MTVRVERTVTIPAPRAAVWEFIADPERRAGAISVVEDYELRPDGTAVWHLSLPIPFLDRTVAVETEETLREPPERVEFEGRSRVMQVLGEHLLEEQDGETVLTSRFVVEGRVPGVERFFERRMEAEFDNLETAIADYLGVTL